jgi:hypothetical protein
MCTVKREMDGFYLFGSSDQTNNGSEISDPDAVNCKCLDSKVGKVIGMQYNFNCFTSSSLTSCLTYFPSYFSILLKMQINWKIK